MFVPVRRTKTLRVARRYAAFSTSNANAKKPASRTTRIALIHKGFKNFRRDINNPERAFSPVDFCSLDKIFAIFGGDENGERKKLAKF